MPKGVSMMSVCENIRDIDICFYIVEIISQYVGLDSFSVIREIAHKLAKG